MAVRPLPASMNLAAFPPGGTSESRPGEDVRSSVSLSQYRRGPTGPLCDSEDVFNQLGAPIVTPADEA